MQPFYGSEDPQANAFNYTQAQLVTFLHELAHSFDAPDHYHQEKRDNPDECENADICDECATPSSGRERSCLMGSGGASDVTLPNREPEEVFCSLCFADIENYLSKNC